MPTGWPARRSGDVYSVPATVGNGSSIVTTRPLIVPGPQFVGAQTKVSMPAAIRSPRPTA